jgi:hypothetical protein
VLFLLLLTQLRQSEDVSSSTSSSHQVADCNTNHAIDIMKFHVPFLYNFLGEGLKIQLQKQILGYRWNEGYSTVINFGNNLKCEGKNIQQGHVQSAASVCVCMSAYIYACLFLPSIKVE